jgi:hypothetical protein
MFGWQWLTRLLPTMPRPNPRERAGQAGDRGESTAVTEAIMTTGALELGKHTGRRKSSGPREASGRLSRSLRDELGGYPPAAVKRLADAAIWNKMDLEWGTPIGQLFLAGKLDEFQVCINEATNPPVTLEDVKDCLR